MRPTLLNMTMFALLYVLATVGLILIGYQIFK